MIKPLNGIKAASVQKKRGALKDSLIRYEAKLGGELFGPIPKGRERQFFCLDEQTWVWHEQWRDEQGHEHSTTTRYIVRAGNGVIKTNGDGNYQRLSEAEARHLYQAVTAYENKVHVAYEKLLAPAL